MSLLDQAQAVFQGLVKNPPYANCYWYGWIAVDGQQAVIHYAKLNNAQCLPPAPGDPPYLVGWDDPAGSPYVGTIGPYGRTVAFTDCSGFAAYVIRKESESAYASIRQQLQSVDPALQAYLAQVDKGHPQPWPSAADYAALGMGGAAAPFQSLGGNAAFDPAGLQPGDLVAWGLAPESGDTGHVVVVAGSPASSGGIWSVSVIDASILPHQNDQRPCGSGVGQGTIALQLVAGASGSWQVNFDPGKDNWHAVEYLSALRLNA